MTIPILPSFSEEEKMADRGYRLVAGIDEAGRGPLAGPVVAAAVILPLGMDTPWLAEVRDSKLLSPAKRESLFHRIRETAVACATGASDSEIIDRVGIVTATRRAMKMALDRLSPPAESLIIDYMSLPEVTLPQKGITNGDRLCLSIACASIVAKVIRDRMMLELDRTYPGYGLSRHKGYGTREHMACLRRLGPCPVHRRSFKPVREIAHEP